MLKKNEQEGGPGSTNIQAENIQVTQVHNHYGPSLDELRSIMAEMVSDELAKYKGEAKITAERRSKVFDEKLSSTWAAESPETLEAAKDPNFQDSLLHAHKEFAKSESPQLGENLINLLIQRSKESSQDMKGIVLNEAIRTIPLLTNEQLQLITQTFIVTETALDGVRSIKTYHGFLTGHVFKFAGTRDVQRSDLQHIEYTGCGTVGIGSRNILETFQLHYANVLNKGIEAKDFETHKIDWKKFPELFELCPRNPERIQCIIKENEDWVALAALKGINQHAAHSLFNLNRGSLFNKNEFNQELKSLGSAGEWTVKAWDTGGLQHLQLTSVGVAIAVSNLKKVTKMSIDLGIWIK